ncbi:MAG: ABC transporter ATP-binding protein [Kiritimatiellaeota bacterium]|nr:ABC transporter ATP-binding protein [Kiritimatiellota bacterium]
MNILELQSVQKSFGETGVLRGVDFTLAEGEFAAIMGPSGSGKSTLLHLAAGLLLPDGGEIRVNGAPLSGMDDDGRTVFRRRNIGLVFQDFNLIPTLTAEENILLPLMLDKAAVDRGHIAGLVARFELGPRRGHYPHQLSGGERQRVAIARALAMRPGLLLADEPTGNLDILSGQKFCGVLAEIHAAYGTSILLVSHDPIVASRASRVAILVNGQIHGDFASKGDPSEISRRYLEKTIVPPQ